MAEILHKIGIKATPEKIYQALTTDNGLSQWWTTDTSGAGNVGSVIKFRFNEHESDFKVIGLEPNASVKWQCVTGPSEWKGTEISFLLQPDARQTFLCFEHSKWREATNFMAHCCTKWAVFLLSLKDFIETGKGRPFPNDVQIDHS
jgi:uncharacterized protein YndB with AHSA1/START domain